MLHISHRFYMSVSGIIFFLVAVAHALRSFYEWDLVYHTWSVPIWVSWLVALVAFLMALGAIRHMH